MTEQTTPPLPSGSVDLAALHKAAVDGKDLAEAIGKATTRVEPKPEKAPAPAKAEPATTAPSAKAASSE